MENPPSGDRLAQGENSDELPLPVVGCVRDKQGRDYQVTKNEAHGYIRFTINYCGKRVGYANCHFENSEVLFADDLHIEDKVLDKPWVLIFGMFPFPPMRWRTVNYRKRGLGTAMIEFLANFARSQSAKRIKGKVKFYDFKDNPDLPDWYRRRGFNVEMGNKKAAYVAMIALEIAAD